MEDSLNEALSQQKVADSWSDDSSTLYQDAMESLCEAEGGGVPCPKISVEEFEDVEEAFLPNDALLEEPSNLQPHAMLKHSQSDKCLNSLAVGGMVDRKRLLSDTKLVVLHYISGSCSSCSTSPSPAASLLPSPIDSDADGRFKVWEMDSLCNKDREKRRRFYRPRFNSTPALRHPSEGDAQRSDVTNETGLAAAALAPTIAEYAEGEMGGTDTPTPTSTSTPDTEPSDIKTTRPKLKIDVIAAQNYQAAAMHHQRLRMNEEQPEFDFLTAEEKLQMDIEAEVTRTLSALDLDDELLPRTPHTKVADFLQVIGKQYDKAFSDTIRQNVPPTPPHVREANYGLKYSQFVHLIDGVTDQLCPIGGWQQIALYMRFGSALVSHLMTEGRAGVTFVADYTARIIFERAAGFLVEHGGWGAVANMSPTNPLFTSSSSCSTNQSHSPLPLHGAAACTNNIYNFSMQGTLL